MLIDMVLAPSPLIGPPFNKKEDYYKLSLLRKTKDGAEWEKIYFKIKDEKKGEVIMTLPQSMSPLNFRLEKISEERLNKETRIIDQK